MKVLVTGGTGFVGSHTVEALLGAGHAVRLLARSRDRIAAALGPAASHVEHLVRDVRDEAGVRRALEDCDAVVHAASVFSWDPKQAPHVREVNVRAAEVVLGTAAELGLDPIVHVSGCVALELSAGTMTADSPVADPPVPYAASKAASERIARRLQEEGAPVVSTYPGMIWGPRDPYVGETSVFARAVVRGGMPFLPPGVMPVVDVRDVAAVHAAALQPGLGPRRYTAVSECLPGPEVIALIRELTGRRLPGVKAPGWLLHAAGGVADTAARLLPVGPTLNSGIAWVARQPWIIDASDTTRALGVTFRPARESIADTIVWLHEQGHLTARQVGRLRPPAALEPA